MTPKPLSEAVKKGFAYLASQQHPNGGWSQGGGWRSNSEGGRVEGAGVEDPPDVANTCAATLALLRGENTPRQGEYAPQALRGLDFIVGNVERQSVESPYVTDLRGTQIQTKIGPLADTFLASLVLSEAKGLMPDEASEARLSAALDTVIAKLERCQQANGTWAMDGWAPVVGQSLGTAGLNRARQRGARVADETLERAEKYARSQYDARTRTHGMEGSAGVPLYSVGSQMSSASHSVYNFKAMKADLNQTAASPAATPVEQERAQAKLKNIEEAEAAHEESMAGSYAYLKDENFRQGFGSNGGEEFLSYLNIAEALLAKGGKEWEDWDRTMTRNMERIQNADGSWSGHHCITGRTFCTATALLVLLADRAPRPDHVVV